MTTILRIILIRLLAGKKLQIALNIKGQVNIVDTAGPVYIGPGIETSRVGYRRSGLIPAAGKPRR